MKIKPKYVLHFFILLIIFCAVLWKTSGQNEIASQNDLRLQKTGEPAKVVLEFWENSLLGENNNNSALITGTPSDFVVFTNSCDSKQNQIIDVKSSSDDNQTIRLSNRGGSSSVENGNRLRISYFTTKIREGNYKILEIVEQREKDNEALVRIGYGNESSPWNQDNFLLHKEGGNWKIFAVMGSWQLEKINMYFAKDVDCKQ